MDRTDQSASETFPLIANGKLFLEELNPTFDRLPRDAKHGLKFRSARPIRTVLSEGHDDENDTSPINLTSKKAA